MHDFGKEMHDFEKEKCTILKRECTISRRKWTFSKRKCTTLRGNARIWEDMHNFGKECLKSEVSPVRRNAQTRNGYQNKKRQKSSTARHHFLILISSPPLTSPDLHNS